MRRILASLITHAYHPTKKAKGIVHEYAWLDKHPNVLTMVVNTSFYALTTKLNGTAHEYASVVRHPNIFTVVNWL